MGAGVVLDTSFLITLADPVRKNHAVARRYWRHFMEQNIPVFLPTIVVSEFCVRQEIPPEILRCCVVLPFNWDEAIKTAQIDFTQFRSPGDSRVAIKDDVKIIAQAMIRDAQHVITEETGSRARMASELKRSGRVGFKTICLKDGFDRSFFDPNGQSDFDDTLNQTDVDT